MLCDGEIPVCDFGPRINYPDGILFVVFAGCCRNMSEYAVTLGQDSWCSVLITVSGKKFVCSKWDSPNLLGLLQPERELDTHLRVLLSLRMRGDLNA